MHILGNGQRVMRPVFAFFVGDYPAQLRVRNFMGAQCKFACVTCTYPSTTGVAYDEKIHLRKTTYFVAEY